MPPSKTTIAPPEPPPDETTAHDLLPAEPAAAAPPRRIGVRRVVGHGLGERLLARRGWRPAGNSRRFWSKIEDDDPFLPRPPGARVVDEGAVGFSVGSSHEMYPADRLSRTSGSGPPPKSIARQTHTPENRTAPAPRPVSKPAPTPPRPAPPPQKPVPSPPKPLPKPAPPPVAVEPAAPPPTPAIDRRPPRIVPNEPHRPSGRVAVAAAKAPTVRHQLVDPQGRPSSEVRREVEEARSSPMKGKPGPPPARSLDEILGILGELKVAEQLYREGKLDGGPPEEELPRPKPNPQPRPATQPRPVSSPRPPPPRAAPPPEEEEEEDFPAPPVNRSPAAASAAGSLDDLFGAGESRVRIGKRTVPKPKADESR